MHVPDKSWSQAHYDGAKEIIPDDVEFRGPGSAMQQELEFDLGRALPADEIYDVTDRTVGAFQAHDVPMEDAYVKAGYRGACNVTLLLTIRFDNDPQ